MGGRLAGFSKSWQDAPKWQRSVLARGLGWRFSRPPPLKKNLPVKLPCEKRLNSLLKDLLGKKVIEKSCDKFVFISRLKLVPKPSGEFRLILDVSRLNKYIPPLSFKMPKLSDLRAILPKGAWLAKIDLKDAYHHVPIRKSFRKFLAFRWGNRVYHFKALPFGLSVAPAVFTGMMNPVHQKLREAGISAIAYLDDWLFWHKTEGGCHHAVLEAIRIFQSMGWLINFDKSTTVPNQRITWLGVEWDSIRMEMRLPRDKSLALIEKVSIILEARKSSRRQVESIIGSMAFVAQFSDEAGFRKKCFSPILSVWPRELSRDSPIEISCEDKRPLLWWTNLENVMLWNPIRIPDPTIVVWTDASNSGWGGHTENGSWRMGRWSEGQKTLHINILEIMAITNSIRADLLKGHNSALVYTDNITTLFAINKNGSSRSR